jgi:hypothetical protein
LRESVGRAVASPWAPSVAPLLAFASALEAGSEADARAAAQRGARDIGLVLRAYVAACFDDDANAAEAVLANLDDETGMDALAWLRAITEARILALKGEVQGAQRVHDQLARDIRDSGAPQPFWERLVASDRRRK